MFIASLLVFLSRRLLGTVKWLTRSLVAGISRLLFLPSLPPYQSQQGRRHIAELKKKKTKRTIDATKSADETR